MQESQRQRTLIVNLFVFFLTFFPPLIIDRVLSGSRHRTGIRKEMETKRERELANPIV
jgi:hypothetical protein